MMMNEVLAAAWISGLLQGVPALLTAVVAFMAVRAWRPNALGQRKIKLAEGCLIQAWELDREIRKARLPFLIGIHAPAPEVAETAEQREKRTAAIPTIDDQFMKCLKLQREFEKTFELTEFYLGEIPRVPFAGTKASFDIAYEYGLIIGSLRFHFLSAFSGSATGIHSSLDQMKSAIDSYNNYSGFITDQSEDEYTIRLRIVRNTLERSMRKMLQQRGFASKLLDYVSDRMIDRFHRKQVRNAKVFDT